MKTIKSFIFSESKLAKAIFSLLIIGVFVLVFGPNLYAQFSRQDGPAGWGYGYGYGYGYGFGFDAGTTSGYRISGAAANQYNYGYGYGYLDPAVTYDYNHGYNVSTSNLTSLVTTGEMIPAGGNLSNTTQVGFSDKATVAISSDVSVTIPAGTTFTSGSAIDFSALAGGTSVSASLTGVTNAGAMSFGIPGVNLTVSPAITIAINVGSTYEGQTLNVYRQDADGIWNNTGSTCVVASGICSFTTTHLSSFVVGPISTSSGSTTTTTGGGGGGSVSTVSCTNVTYGEYAGSCFNGYQYRNVVTSTPSGCSLTAAQLDAARRACTVSNNGGGVTTPVESGDFVAIEKSLVTKVNSALVKRLAGRILLQVESHGEAWYVNPVNGLKYYLGTPADAFLAMKKLGLGVSNKTFATFKNSKAPARLAGRILIKVEDSGKAYYVNPVNLKLYYLGRPSDAYNVMRTLGLGITNTNLRQISVGQ